MCQTEEFYDGGLKKPLVANRQCIYCFREFHNVVDKFQLVYDILPKNSKKLYNSQLAGF